MGILVIISGEYGVWEGTSPGSLIIPEGGSHGNGRVHEEDEQKESDVERDKVLNDMGLQVVRIKNDDVVKNLPGVLRKVRELISE